VSTEALAPLAVALGVGDAVLLGKGEAASGGRGKASILADTFEALIGACYLDGGLEAAAAFVLAQLEPRIDAVIGRGELGDAKNRLQELAARCGDGPPRYVVRSGGPDHARWFTAEVYLGEGLVGDGRGKSKKRAEQAAAAAACASLAERRSAGSRPDLSAAERRSAGSHPDLSAAERLPAATADA
jgi:ribonuclease-3